MSTQVLLELLAPRPSTAPELGTVSGRDWSCKNTTALYSSRAGHCIGPGLGLQKHHGPLQLQSWALYRAGAVVALRKVADLLNMDCLR